MSIYKMNFFGPVSFLERQWHQRLVQICVFAALLFFLLGSYDLIDQVQKMLRKVGLKFGKDSTRAVNAVLFGLLLFLLTRFVMDPVIKRMANGTVEGQTNADQLAVIMKRLKKKCDDEVVARAAEGSPTPYGGPKCKRYNQARDMLDKVRTAKATLSAKAAEEAAEEAAGEVAAEDFAAKMAEEAALDAAGSEFEQKATQVETDAQAALDAAGAEFEQKATQEADAQARKDNFVKYAGIQSVAGGESDTTGAAKAAGCKLACDMGWDCTEYKKQCPNLRCRRC
tara:strand:- start:2937 stop:3785 length:849 start_codon:yes stop_codon:yes gene_type:complete